MTDIFHRHRYPARRRFLSLLTILAVSTSVGGAPIALAQQSDAGLPPAIEAVVSHPSVAAARARICSTASQYDQARSQELPQVDLGLGGSSSLSSHVETRETESRRLDDREVDAVIGIDQVIYDWGVIEADKNIALSTSAASRIDMILEIERVAANIVDLSLQIAEHRERQMLYANFMAELLPAITRLEESVAAGAQRIGDLRAIKLIELDADIAHSQAQRQAELAEAELSNRFGLSPAEGQLLLDQFLHHRPEVIPVIVDTVAGKRTVLGYILSPINRAQSIVFREK